MNAFQQERNTIRSYFSNITRDTGRPREAAGNIIEKVLCYPSGRNRVDPASAVACRGEEERTIHVQHDGSAEFHDGV